MEKGFSFTSLITQLAYSEYELSHFNKNIKEHSKMFNHLSRLDIRDRPNDDTPIFSESGDRYPDKTNYNNVERYYKTVGRTKLEFLQLNALCRAFFGQPFINGNERNLYGGTMMDFKNETHIDFESKIDSFPFIERSLDNLAKNENVLKYAEKYGYTNYLNKESPSWFANRYFRLSKIISYRTALYKAGVETGHLMNGTQLFLRSIDMAFINPGIKELDKMVECSISQHPLGTTFSRQELEENHGYPYEFWCDDFIKTSTDTFFNIHDSEQVIEKIQVSVEGEDQNSTAHNFFLQARQHIIVKELKEKLALSNEEILKLKNSQTVTVIRSPNCKYFSDRQVFNDSSSSIKEALFYKRWILSGKARMVTIKPTNSNRKAYVGSL